MYQVTFPNKQEVYDILDASQLPWVIEHETQESLLVTFESEDDAILARNLISKAYGIGNIQRCDIGDLDEDDEDSFSVYDDLTADKELDFDRLGYEKDDPTEET